MAKITVKIKTSAKESGVVSENPWVVHVKAPPKEGKANKELVKILANHVGIPQSQVKILHGLQSKLKVVELHQLHP